MLAQIEKKNLNQSQESINAAFRLKGDYEKLQKEMREELEKELEEFYKNFIEKIVEFDLSPDDQILIKDYFEAFIGTFSSVFDASRAIISEQFQLNSGCLLSTFASFASFIDDNLPKEITSIEKFLSIKGMKTNAKKFLKLFSDSTYLNAVIGKIAEKIVMSQTKREQILSVTQKELDHINRNLMEKISKFCEQMSEIIEVDSYRKLYNTPAARFGHMDAND